MTRAFRPVRVIALAAASLLVGCVSQPGAVPHGDPDPPSRVTRTGVPVLMDIPVLGVLFRRETVSR